MNQKVKTTSKLHRQAQGHQYLLLQSMLGPDKENVHGEQDTDKAVISGMTDKKCRNLLLALFLTTSMQSH